MAESTDLCFKRSEEQTTAIFSEYFVEVNGNLRLIALCYDDVYILTPTVLNKEYKRQFKENIPYEKAHFSNLVDYIQGIPNYIKFCGEPSLDTKIEPIITPELEYMNDMIKNQRKRNPGFDRRGGRIFYLSYENQWEIVKYVLLRPYGVPYEHIENIFIKKFNLYETHGIRSCEQLMSFLKHTDLVACSGMVFHSMYFDSKKMTHKFMKNGKLTPYLIEKLQKTNIEGIVFEDECNQIK